MFGVRLVVYAKMGCGILERIETVIDLLGIQNETYVSRTITELTQSLIDYNDQFTVFLLLVGSQRDLREIISIGNLFQNTRLVIILSEPADEMMVEALALRPRFISYFDSMEISAVLGKMLGLEAERKHV